MEDYTIIKDSDGNIQSITRNKAPAASIPVCAGNSDYTQYLEDVTNGAMVDEVVMEAPTTTPARDLSAELDIIQAVIDDMILGGV